MPIGPLLLIVAAPLLELALLIKVGQAIGLWPTLGLIAATGIAGVVVIRSQGLRAVTSLLAAGERGEPMAEALVGGGLRLIAGALLVLPGLLGDAAGLILLVPPVRSWLARRIISSGHATVSIQRFGWRRRSRAQASGPQAGPPPRADRADGPVIEGEFERVDERPLDPRGDDTRPPPVR